MVIITTLRDIRAMQPIDKSLLYTWTTLLQDENYGQTATARCGEIEAYVWKMCDLYPSHCYAEYKIIVITVIQQLLLSQLDKMFSCIIHQLDY